MKYKTRKEIEDLVNAFETATISRDAWKHAEHLIVALFYVSTSDLPTATLKMKDGIFNLLTNGFGVDLSKEMPYHETLTQFWMLVVARFHNAHPGPDLAATADELVTLFDKDYPLRFYSRDYLFSDTARSEFAEPDLVPLAGAYHDMGAA